MVLFLKNFQYIKLKKSKLIERAHYYTILVEGVRTIREGVLIEEGALTETWQTSKKAWQFQNINMDSVESFLKSLSSSKLVVDSSYFYFLLFLLLHLNLWVTLGNFEQVSPTHSVTVGNCWKLSGTVKNCQKLSWTVGNFCCRLETKYFSVLFALLVSWLLI